jgi:hypothetical protein
MAPTRRMTAGSGAARRGLGRLARWRPLRFVSHKDRAMGSCRTGDGAGGLSRVLASARTRRVRRGCGRPTASPVASAAIVVVTGARAVRGWR